MNIEIREIHRDNFYDIPVTEIKKMTNDGCVFIVKEAYSKKELQTFREHLRRIDMDSEPEWYPLYDGCPDYHRINDEYENSYVKTKAHQFFFHLWYQHNDPILSLFKDTFELKSILMGHHDLSYIRNRPSHGFVSRVVVHHYPCGGGYTAEHQDPVNEWNPLQTIIKASENGVDFEEGGLYVKTDVDAEPIELEKQLDMGDMVVFDQALPHGVNPIDPHKELDWSLDKGRFLIIPLSLRSDYQKDVVNSPNQIN